MSPLPRSRGAGFVAAALAFAVGTLGTTIPTPLHQLYRDQFGFSELMITVIFAVYAAGVIAALLLFGRFSDQIGRRPLLIGGLALSLPVIGEGALTQAVGLRPAGIVFAAIVAALSATVLLARRGGATRRSALSDPHVAIQDHND